MINQKEQIEVKHYKREFTFLKIFIFICFSLTASRLWFLQIHHGSDFRHFSNANRFKNHILQAPRGILFDRENKVLAGNKIVLELKMNLNYITDPPQTIESISKIIHWSSEKIMKK